MTNIVDVFESIRNDSISNRDYLNRITTPGPINVYRFSGKFLNVQLQPFAKIFYMNQHIQRTLIVCFGQTNKTMYFKLNREGYT